VWNTRETVVTSLHVVAGCKKIGVYYPGGQVRDARLARSVKASDLALLVVDNPLDVKALVASPTPPAAGARMVTWGYPAKVNKLFDTTIFRRQTGGTVRGLLNDASQTAVERVGMPDLDGEVIYLDLGHLLPGNSGGPLLDESGRVVGIADGGLEQGAIAVSWAIPARRLSELRDSMEPRPDPTTRTDLLFAAEVVSPGDLEATPAAAAGRPALTKAAAGYKCGGTELVKMRTRTFAQMSASADDQGGLQKIMLGAGQFLRADDAFDIYQHLETGATVVAPAGARFRSEAGLCIVEIGGDLQQLIRLERISGTMDAQAASVRYEQELLQRFAPDFWQPDPQWSYVVPFMRQDGLVVNRKAGFGVVPGAFGPTIDRYIFETLATRGPLFFAVAAVRSGLSPQRLQVEQMCILQPQLPDCGTVRTSMRLAAQVMVATHLSTFPIG
jgi:hypothetical protein